MTRRHTPLAVALLLVACAATSASSQASADSSAVRVWVNPRSGVYHCPGTPPYGTTARGFYVSEADAKARRYRPAGGRVCAGGAKGAARLEHGPRPLSGEGTEQPTSFLAALRDPASPRRPTTTLERCTVSHIVDGDGIECRELGEVRLIGIDAPERAQSPWFAVSTAALTSLIPVGSVVELELDVENQDRYSRRLAYVWSDEIMVNWVMARMGWAVAYPYGRTARYRVALDGAERTARTEGRGLWPAGGLDCRPAEFKSKRC